MDAEGCLVILTNLVQLYNDLLHRKQNRRQILHGDAFWGGRCNPRATERKGKEREVRTWEKQIQGVCYLATQLSWPRKTTQLVVQSRGTFQGRSNSITAPEEFVGGGRRKVGREGRGIYMPTASITCLTGQNSLHGGTKPPSSPPHTLINGV